MRLFDYDDNGRKSDYTIVWNRNKFSNNCRNSTRALVSNDGSEIDFLNLI